MWFSVNNVANRLIACVLSKEGDHNIFKRLDFSYSKCERNFEGAMSEKVMVDNHMESLREFTFLSYRFKACGWCEVVLTVGARFCCVIMKEMFSLRPKAVICKHFVQEAILCRC